MSDSLKHPSRTLQTPLRASASPPPAKPLSNESRARLGGNAVLQRYGSDYYSHLVAKRWAAQSRER